MKNAMKKLLSAVLALVLVVGMCPAAFATEVDAAAETEATVAATEETVAATEETVAETEATVPETEATVPETEPTVSETVPTTPEVEADEPAASFVTFYYSVDDSFVKVEVKNGKVTTPSEKFFNGYSFRGWMVAGKLVDPGVEIDASVAGSSVSASYVETNPVSTYTLNVYARKYVDGTLKSTQLIHKNQNMQKNDNVLEYLNTVKAELRSQVEKRFPTCTWSGTFYNYYGDTVATDNVLTTNGEKNIYINCWSQEAAEILVYIYRSTTKEYSRIIEIDGYEAGEVVTRDAVKAEVKKHYSYSKMRMFDEEGWADFKDSKENTNTEGVSVKSNGTTKIYVYLSSSSASSSSTSGSKADSSNPKTGDNIFMAVTVMTMSAAALVYVFGKKRAVK